MSRIAVNRLARQQRRPGPEPGERGFQAAELVRLATLAPSSHNAQPWRFRIDGHAIRIVPDLTRRLPLVDPDDAHLLRSLGCAAENLVHAASAQGFASHIVPADDGRSLRVELIREQGLTAGPYYRALLHRQCNRRNYSGEALPTAVLDRIQAAGTGPGIGTRLYVGERAQSAFIDCLRAGNQAQLGHPAFVRELIDWMRFNSADALRNQDGLASAALGKPALPRWLGRRLLPLILSPDRQTRQDAQALRSASGIAVIIADGNTRLDCIRSGMAAQRLLLEAEFHDVRTAFVNPAIETPGVGESFRSWLGVDGWPMLMIRLGRGPRAPYSLRRPVADVIDVGA
ncbi:MAG: hypothetical protein JJU22_13265 [Gammaproteobacteria bacterium]|nr:hypothetical protein [Gammaproteobacteria bacterium]